MAMLTMTEARSLRLGYLVSRYPSISHSFILREVLELQRLGFSIAPASVNAPDRPLSQLTNHERTEAERTFYIKRSGAGTALVATSVCCLRSPVRFARTLLNALKLGGLDAGKILYQIFYFVEACVVAEWMRRRRLTHLHVHFATEAAMVGMLSVQLAEASLSITVHGPDEFYDAPGYRLREKIEACKFLCAIGDYARSQLMKLSAPEHWEKIEVVRLGVDPALFALPPVRPAPEKFEILCVGRLVPAKGQHILLAAAAELVAHGRKFLIRFVGNGPDLASLERAVAKAELQDYVRFEGAVNQDRIRDYFERASAFALPSFAEGIPVALMEAMAMQVPCVTTWITGIPELIRNEVDGLLVAPSDTLALAAALERLMEDDDLRRRLGESGRARVIAQFHLQHNVERLAELFTRRLNREGKP
jgi:glycosyltransferase involved in cell wall biosynthesis